MAMYVKLVILCCALSLGQVAYSLKCKQCVSAEAPPGVDQSTVDATFGQLGLASCDGVDTSPGSPEVTCNQNATLGEPECLKMSVTIVVGGVKMPTVTRGCSGGFDLEGRDSAGCVSELNNEYKRAFNVPLAQFEDARVCYCGTDYCNAGIKIVGSTYTLMMVLLAVFVFGLEI
jgi:hypothetical protein